MPVYTQNQIQFPKVMVIGPSGYVADVNSSGQLQTTGSGGGGSGTVTNVATSGIATGGPISTTGTITVLGSGNTTTAATAAANLAAAVTGHVVTTDGSGNVQDSGTLLSNVGTVKSVSGAGIATGTVTTTGSITVTGSGNTTTATTAGASIAGAPNNDIITADGSGNVKDSGVLISSLVTIAQTTVSFSATPTFNAATGSNFKITLTGNVTSSTLSGATAGQTIIIEVVEDVTGGRTFVWPTNIKNGMNLSANAGQPIQASETNVQAFYYDGTNAYAISPGMTYP